MSALVEHAPSRITEDRPLLAWLHNPAQDRGLHFARPKTGWDFVSYADVAEESYRLAALLQREGVEPGDVVAIMLPASPGFVSGFFAVLLAAATPAPIAPQAVFQRRLEFRRHVEHLLVAGNAQFVLTHSELAPSLAFAEDVGARLVLVDAEFEGGKPTPETGALGLLQFTSGSTRAPRAVRVPRAALEANIAAIRRWLGMTPQDATATWLPVHHDMGLIGCVLTPVVNESDVWMMQPEQFIRSPVRWLRCFGTGRASLTAVPAFSLAHVVRRADPDALDGMDFSEWRALIVGAERIDPVSLAAFTALVERFGFDRRAVLPAYGLAEATLAVTGSPLDTPVTLLTIDADLRLAQPIRNDRSAPEMTLVGCGKPLQGAAIRIVGSSGEDLADGVLGEICVGGRSLTAGYAPRPGQRSIEFGDDLPTGDAGFLLDGELFVVGRLGDSIKVRGRAVFAEDLDLRARDVLPRRAHTVVLLGTWQGRERAVMLLEASSSLVAPEAVGEKLQLEVPDVQVIILEVPRGTIMRTTSGKPRRRLMWERLLSGEIAARELWSGPDLQAPTST